VKRRQSKRGVTKYSQKVKKLLFGTRLPFAPTRSQPPTTAEVLLIPQVKRDRAFLEGEGIGDKVCVLVTIGPPIDTSKDRELLLGAAPSEGPELTVLPKEPNP
jgi:hypothetical protein